MQSIQRKMKRSIITELQHAFKDNNTELFNLMIEKIKELDIKNKNIITLSDAYKYTHQVFYPKGMTKLYSYLESRGGKFQKTLFFGLQYIIKEYLTGQVITQEKIDDAENTLNGVFGKADIFDKSKFQYILDNYGGKLPVRIKAVPEGSLISVKNVLMTIENTGDENTAWITNWLESLLLQVWYPITVATLSFHIKKTARKYFEKTSDLSGDALEMALEFMLNDFGLRGVSSVESAEIGGAAHLTSFLGSDNVPASQMIRHFYNTNRVFGNGIPATEHSVMTLKGEEGELEMFEAVLDAYPTGMVACVSDSYNIFRAVKDYWGDKLKAKILARPSAPGNQLVIRPDSGDPKRTLQEIFKLLFEGFGYTTNSKGYKVLPPQIRVIQGDGVNIDSISEIFKMMDEEKISVENLVFGMGGKLLQADINRDTQNFAFKACFVIINGKSHNVVKSPTEMDKDGNITESFKKSKSGMLKLVKDCDNYRTVSSLESEFESVIDEMIPVFENGDLLVDESFEVIRERVRAQ